FESQARSEDLRGVRGLMFVHIPLPEILLYWNAYGEDPHLVVGERDESVACSSANTGLFAAALGLNVSGIFHGHNHNNDFLARVESTTRTIHVGYGRKSGYGGYGGVLADKPGARVIIMKLDEDRQDYTWSTYIRLENNSTAHETVRQVPFKSEGIPSASPRVRALCNRKKKSGGGILCPLSAARQSVGYIESKRYFYAVMEAEWKPHTSPTFVLFPGGLGDSALTMALGGLGPCEFWGDEEPWRYRSGFTEQTNGIFIDAPGPTGFSTGPIEQTVEEIIDHMTVSVLELFKRYPRLNNKVHLFGFSASATFVAMLGDRIVKLHNSRVDLAGVLLMSGVVGPSEVYRGCYEMARKRKLLTAEQLVNMFKALENCEHQIAMCNGNGVAPPPSPRDWPAECDDVEQNCMDAFFNPLEEKGIDLYDVRHKAEPEDCNVDDHPPYRYLNRPDVQRKLGVSGHWQHYNDEVLDALLKYNIYDATYHVEQLLDNGVKVLVLHGDQDYITNSVGALAWVLKLNGSIEYGSMLAKVTAENIPRCAPPHALGTIRSLEYTNGAKLAFIEVSDAGHLPMIDRPLRMLSVFNSFISGLLWH
ncbi:hypothetical protein FOZ61_009343, partial [Perkinsus olseni]